MGWFEQVDGYCERLGPGLWAEPWNAVSNLAFLIAALVMWRRTAGVPLGRAMCAVLAAIAVGSGLFHTVANRLTGVLDVAPIVGFVLLYVFAAIRDLLRLTGWRPWAAVAGFVPYAALTVPLWARVPGLGSSAVYAPVPVLILFYAWLLRKGAPLVARGLAVGAAVLVVSLGLRTIDGAVCGAWPVGTHFLWHLLNAVMLGWMIEVYVRGVRRSHGGQSPA